MSRSNLRRIGSEPDNTYCYHCGTVNWIIWLDRVGLLCWDCYGAVCKEQRALEGKQ
jgi:hypothetical protein